MTKSKKSTLKDDLVDVLLDENQESSIDSAPTRVYQPKADASPLTIATAIAPSESATKVFDKDPTKILDKEPTKIGQVAIHDRDLKEISSVIQSELKVVEPPQIQHFRESATEISQKTRMHGITAIENMVASTESLRLAQERILNLEKEVDAFRVENDQLRAAETTLRQKVEDLEKEVQQQQVRNREAKVIYAEEMSVIEERLQAKDREISNYKIKIEELERRMLGDVKRIRVRERELENRLELLKIENTAIIRSKDELILQLKRSVDQGLSEIENYKNKGRITSGDLEAHQEKIKRTVRALRMTLSMLDGEDETFKESEKKKAG